MRTILSFSILFYSLALNSAVFATDAGNEFPHIKDMKKCPKCVAMFDATPHPTDYRQCPKCQYALERGMAYLKKNFSPTMFGLLLDSFYGGFAFMMDDKGGHEKELAVCVKNARAMIKPAPDGNFASGSEIGESWCSWKKSMAMYFLCEYSLRYGLTPENKASLIEGAKFATETVTKGGGWFHSKPVDKQYAPDIAIIGTIFYASFLEMEALGIDPGPIKDETRKYLESISDGKTIGYSKGWKGGMGGGGADGFITLGLMGSGNPDDKWASGLGNWMKQNYMDAPHGHANGDLHYFGLGAGLHRLGAEHYARYATCHVHRLIDLQRDDGGIPGMIHDTSNEVELYDKMKADPNTKSSFPSTAVFVCMILMEKPGVFAALPAKPAGSLANKDAFKQGTEALEKYDYAKAYKLFSVVLPGGDAGELIPKAREQMRAIETTAKKALEVVQAKEAELAKTYDGKTNMKEEVVALTNLIKEYEKFAKDFEGTMSSQNARKLAEPIQKSLSAKRQRMIFSMPATAAAPASSGASGATSLKAVNDTVRTEWEGKLKARAREVIAAGNKPRCEFKKLGSQMSVLELNSTDAMKVMLERGGQMDVSWSQLAQTDKRSLALDIAKSQDKPADHALAAFYLLCENDSNKAEDHLSRAGAEAAKVRAVFEVQ